MPTPEWMDEAADRDLTMGEVSRQVGDAIVLEVRCNHVQATSIIIGTDILDDEPAAAAMIPELLRRLRRQAQEVPAGG